MDPLENGKEMNTETDDQLQNLEITNESSEKEDITSFNQEQLTTYLQQLLERSELASREIINQVKQLFYKRIKAENEVLKKAFMEAGGEELNFLPEKDAFEEAFKALLNEHRNKRAEHQATIEAEKGNNLLQKQHILDRMKVLVDNNEDVSAHINEFRDLQKKWKSIGKVPQAEVNELWKNYTALTESFWDLIKINNELREYDFKKNLEIKTTLCETAERLDEEEDIISAFRQLQQLHEEWRETGPVAREFREEIWQRFKAASTVINRKHQGHFDDVRTIENTNYDLKVELCKKIEAFDFSQLNSYKEWDEATKTIMGWQEEWRTIGFAPRKLNNKIFEQYRAACDKFFNAKSEFYKDSKKQLTENLEKKKALCAQAEALKENTDWKETTDIFIKLQKEWKSIGPVPRKYSDEIWKQFIAACDYFFEQKGKETAGQRSEEKENLSKKKAIIAKIKELDAIVDKAAPEILASLREHIAEWNETGFVPFRDKDKIHKEYRAAVDKMFEKLNVDANQRRLDSFKTNLKEMGAKGENRLMRERDKLMRSYDHLKSEIATYENNIGFLTSTSKKGSGLIKDMERKIEALKEEARLIEQKVAMIDEE